MRLPVRSLLGLAVALTVSGSTVGAVHALPGDGRDTQDSRDASRSALPSAVQRALDEREASISRASVDIAVRERALQVSEFVKQRAAVEAKLRHADKVKKLGFDPASSNPKAIAKQLASNQYNWGDDQFSCIDKIFTQESNWKVNADNPTSSAYGIPQALPGSKMASEGPDWRTNPATQIKWGLKYIKERYGSPCAAWAFKRGAGWY